MKTKKQLIYVISILLIILTINKTNAQRGLQDIRFTSHIITDPNATIKDGFNIGFGLEYQTNIIYIKAQTFIFPDLRGKTYKDFTGVIGFNYHDRFRMHRIFIGLKGGTIKRDSNPFPTWGGELGYDYYFKGESKGFYVGLQASYDRRTGGKVWDSDIEPYWRKSGHLKTGYSF